MIEAIIFDMDGVLVESEKVKFKACQQVLRGLGIDFSWGAYRKRIGLNAPEFWQSVRAEFPLKEDFADVHNKWQELYLPELEKIPLQPGAIEALQQAKNKGLKIALASSSDMVQIDSVLKKFPPESFDAVISGEHFTHAKPNPEIFLVTAEKLGLEPKKCLVVEDSAAGIAAAKSAGMVCVAVKTDYTKDEERAKADFVIESLKDFDLEKLGG